MPSHDVSEILVLQGGEDVKVLRHSKADILASLMLTDQPEGAGPTWLAVTRPIADICVSGWGQSRPRAGKALVDRACKAILATESRIEFRQEAPGATGSDMRVVVAFQISAGRAEEVRSTRDVSGKDGVGKDGVGEICAARDDVGIARYGWDDLRALIRRKRGEGWEFLLLGAGIDVYDLCRRIGIGPERALSHGADRPANLLALSAAAHNMAAFATGAAADMRFSTAQKMAAGDAHDWKYTIFRPVFSRAASMGRSAADHWLLRAPLPDRLLGSCSTSAASRSSLPRSQGHHDLDPAVVPKDPEFDCVTCLPNIEASSQIF